VAGYRGAVATFGKQVHSTKPRVEVLGAVVTHLADPLHGLGYRIESQSDQGVTFKASAWRSGLLRAGQRITMSFSDAPDGGTYVTIAGEGPDRVARQFDALNLDAVGS
jgi:hypothetical protein